MFAQLWHQLLPQEKLNGYFVLPHRKIHPFSTSIQSNCSMQFRWRNAQIWAVLNYTQLQQKKGNWVWKSKMLSINWKELNLKIHTYCNDREMGILTMSVIAKCAFGMTIDNLGGKDDPFLKNAQVLVDPPQFKSPGIMLLCKHSTKWFWSDELMSKCIILLFSSSPSYIAEMVYYNILPNGKLEVLLRYCRNYDHRTIEKPWSKKTHSYHPFLVMKTDLNLSFDRNTTTFLKRLLKPSLLTPKKKMERKFRCGARNKSTKLLLLRYLLAEQKFFIFYPSYQDFLIHSFPTGSTVYVGWLFNDCQCIDVLLFYVGSTSGRAREVVRPHHEKTWSIRNIYKAKNRYMITLMTISRYKYRVIFVMNWYRTSLTWNISWTKCSECIPPYLRKQLYLHNLDNSS